MGVMTSCRVDAALIMRRAGISKRKKNAEQNSLKPRLYLPQMRRRETNAREDNHKICDHLHWRLRLCMSSSLSAASQRHLLRIWGSTLKVYLELASRRRRRFLTMVAAVWWRSKLTRRSPSTGGASMNAGFCAL